MIEGYIPGLGRVRPCVDCGALIRVELPDVSYPQERCGWCMRRGKPRLTLWGKVRMRWGCGRIDRRIARCFKMLDELEEEASDG